MQTCCRQARSWQEGAKVTPVISKEVALRRTGAVVKLQGGSRRGQNGDVGGCSNSPSKHSLFSKPGVLGQIARQLRI
eukprot:3232173-Amphidinium_carterae.1